MKRILLAAIAIIGCMSNADAQVHLKYRSMASGLLPLVVSDNASDGDPVTASEIAAFESFLQFDPAWGILSGISAALNSGGALTQSGQGSGKTKLLEHWIPFGVSVDPVKVTRRDVGKTKLDPLSTDIVLSADFLGTGNVAAESTVKYAVTADKTGEGDQEQVEATYEPNHNGIRQTLTYIYYDHANASFRSGSDDDRKTVAAGHGFKVHALAGIDGKRNTAALDSVRYSCVGGDCSAFTLDLAPFTGLLAGDFVTGSLLFNTSTPGSYSAKYRLTFVDSIGGGGLNLDKNSLILNATGVIPVPEADRFVMMLVGLGLVGLRLRQRHDVFKPKLPS